MLRRHRAQYFDQMQRNRPVTRQSSFCLEEILLHLKYVKIWRSEVDSYEFVFQKLVVGFDSCWCSHLYFWSSCYCTSQYFLILFCLRHRIWIFLKAGLILARLHFLWRPDPCDVRFQYPLPVISHWNLASKYCLSLTRNSRSTFVYSGCQSCLQKAVSATACEMTLVPLLSYWRFSCACFDSGFWSHRCILAAHLSSYFGSWCCLINSMSYQHLGVFRLGSCFGQAGFDNLQFRPFFFQIASLIS